VDETPNAGRSTSAQDGRELRDIQDQIEQAREVLARLRSDIVESLSRLDGRPSAELVEVNEALVLALLRAQDRAPTHQSARRSSRWPLSAMAGSGHAASTKAPPEAEVLQEANAQLLVAALEAQDRRATAETAQQRQTQFLAVLAHELRGPLAPIQTAVALLGRIRTDEPELMARLRAVIERQVVYIGRMVADLLDVSRLSTGKLRLERRPVDMCTIIDEVTDACRAATESRQQRFLVERPGQRCEVLGDPIRMTQVLNNLLDNASKYTQNGGEIKLSALATGDVLTITVSDNGIGITADALLHVFEPFVQQDHAVGFSSTGLGIGLALAQELVGAHGGTIVATSAGIGAGSQFAVTLPLL
jgi:signal transduction histidine kinase